MVFFCIAVLIVYVLYAVLILYIFHNWNFNNGWVGTKPSVSIKISIVVAARNEANRITNLLESFRKLNYNPQYFEIIIVNDHSEDDTIEVVNNASISNLRVLDLLQDKIGKKNALELGIQSAQYDLIVCTDADCVVPVFWLDHIANDFELHQWKFCAMPVKFISSNSLFNYFQCMDMLGFMGMTYIANTAHSFNMANGANMAFSKSAFYEIKSFEKNANHASGDDMFLVKEISKLYPKSIRTLFNLDVLVVSSPAVTVYDFIQQRLRWGSKNKAIESKEMIIVMFLVWFVSFILIVLFIWLLISFNLFTMVTFMIGLVAKLGIDFIFLKRLSMDFQIEWSSIKYLSSFFINTLYISFLAPLTYLNKSYKWKGRKVS